MLKLRVLINTYFIKENVLKWNEKEFKPLRGSVAVRSLKCVVILFKVITKFQQSMEGISEDLCRGKGREKWSKYDILQKRK